jgi:hypothetical protein
MSIRALSLLLLGAPAWADDTPPAPIPAPTAAAPDTKPRRWRAPSGSGYAELRGSYTQADGQPWALTARLRPTIEQPFSDRIELTVTAEAAYSLGRYTPDEVVRLMDEQIGGDPQLEAMGVDDLDDLSALTGCDISAEPRVDSVGDVLDLPRLFLDVDLRRADLRFGRQAVAWGSAQIFNPTDVFAEVNLNEPWRERAGVDAVRATVPVGASAQLLAVGGVADLPGSLREASQPTPWRAGLRGTVHVASVDLSLVTFTSEERWARDAHLIGLDLKGDLGVGWWIEGGYDGDLRVVAGADYSFPVLQQLVVSGQAYYDGSGEAPDHYDRGGLPDSGLVLEGCDAFTSTLGGGDSGEAASADGARSTLGRWYGTGLVRWALTEEWSVADTTLVNLADGTGTNLTYVTWLATGRVAANLGAQVPLGDDGEFRPSATDLRAGPFDLSGLVPRFTALAWLRLSI